MSIAPYRLLGLAFASADLLVEIDPTGKIAFAVGAAAVVCGREERSLVGRHIIEFVDPDDASVMAALIAGADGRRQGPVVARLAGTLPEAFAITVCKLPQNDGAISCALTRALPPVVGDGVGGLFDRDAFETVTKDLFESARASGQALELSFVDMDGLAEAEAALPAERQTALRTRLAGALRAQSHAGAAAQLDDERFALVRAAGESPEALTGRLTRLIASSVDLGAIKLEARAMALDGEASAAQIARALRYALDDFIEAGLEGAAPATLQEAMSASVRRTLKKASALGAVVSQGKFNIAYQPVVALKSGALHHYEVLVRFGEAQSPFPMIRMAEELDMIEDLDLAIAERAATEMERDAKLKLAVNVSGRTITSESFMARIEDIVRSRNLGGQLMFEVTESALIDDLALADRHIQVLRKLGCEVCLDDFGAGAASLAYLQQLNLDVVKIDGRFIRELQHGAREATFIRHLVRMCAELKVKTLAEMIETSSCEEAVRKAGVDYGQGWYYGAASETPQQPTSHAGGGGPVAARRVGAVESWG